MGRHKSDINNFLSKAKLIHGDKYEYDHNSYVDTNTKFNIICSEHGLFQQRPNNHLAGKGCRKCSHKAVSLKLTLSLEDFISKSNKIHNSEYDYSKSIYSAAICDIVVICKKHGDFTIKAFKHIAGQGCPTCNLHKGESRIKEFLDIKNIYYVTEKKFDDCKDKSYLRFDFYLPVFNLCIEYDGQQHYEAHSFSADQTEITKQKNLIDTKYRDNIKTQYCKDNNINLIRIPYWKYKNVAKILDNYLSKLITEGE